MCLLKSVTPDLASTEVTHKFLQSSAAHATGDSVPFHRLLQRIYFLHVTLLARQTNQHWPYGQKVVLRQISRALVTGSSEWVRVPRSGISWQKADNSRLSLACGDELIGWILAQVKPSATCSLSLWLYSSPTCSLRGSSHCLSQTTCHLLDQWAFLVLEWVVHGCSRRHLWMRYKMLSFNLS